MTGLPPGPESSRFAQGVQWYRDPAGLLERCQAEYGNVFTLRLPPWMNDTVVVAEPELVGAIFKADERLHAGAANSYLRPMLGPNSLLCLDGQTHRRTRRIVMPAFHREKLRQLVPVIAGIAGQATASWPVDEPFELRPKMQEIALDVILRAVFGIADERSERELASRLLAVVATGQAGFTLEPARRSSCAKGDAAERIAEYESRLAEVDTLLAELISGRRAAGGLEQRDDLLSMLLLAGREDGQPLSDGELRDQLMTLLVAGHESTAAALTWGVDLLLHHPDKLDRLLDELANGERGYLEATTQEILRLRPTLPIAPRRVVGGFELGDRSVPDGATVVACIYLLHRHPDLYPAPGSFLPERFLDGRATGHFSWIPFGGGERRCAGANLVMLEMQVVLEAVLASTYLEAVSPQMDRPRRAANVLAPDRGVPVVRRLRR